MIDAESVRSKLKDIRNYLLEVRPLLAPPPAEIVGDTVKLHAIERYFQLIVDTMIKINAHLIAAKQLPVPDTYQSTFTVLAQHHLLDSALALKIAPVVGLRNQLVHKYGDIDLKQFLADLAHGSEQFDEYIAAIEALLEKADSQ